MFAKRKIPTNVVERKRGNKTEIYARISLTTADGKEKQIWRRAESRSHAKQLARQLKREVEDHGPSPIEHGQTRLDAYLERWLVDAVKPRVAARTFSDYSELIDRYIKPRIGRIALANLTPLHIQSFYSWLQTEGGGWRVTVTFSDGTATQNKRKRAGNEAEASLFLRDIRQGLAKSGFVELDHSVEQVGLSPRVVRYTHAVLRSALQQALRWDIVTRNVATLVELPRQTRREQRALTPEQASVLFQSARADQHGIVVAFALLTGARPEEYLALKWSDIDLQSGAAVIRRVIEFGRKGGWSFSDDAKTSRSRRTIPLPAPLTAWLREHKIEQYKARLRAGEEWAGHDLVFTASNGEPILLPNLTRRVFKPLLMRAGLPEIRLYDLRHTHATLLLAAGTNPKIVAERLGHASTTLTMDTYSHVQPTMQQAVTAHLEALLFNAQGQ